MGKHDGVTITNPVVTITNPVITITNPVVTTTISVVPVVLLPVRPPTVQIAPHSPPFAILLSLMIGEIRLKPLSLNAWRPVLEA